MNAQTLVNQAQAMGRRIAEKMDQLDGAGIQYDEVRWNRIWDKVTLRIERRKVAAYYS